jgi:hypothetical protein
VSEGPNISQFRSVASANGITWLKQALQLFKQSPRTWFLSCLAIALVMGLLPFTQILMPVISAGLMFGSQRIQQGKSFEFGHIFKGFSSQFNPLLLAGFIYVASALICYYLAVEISSYLGYPPITLTPEMLNSGTIDMQTIQAYSIAAMLITLIMLGLMLPVFMAFWFAPALIFLQQQSTLDSLKQSFLACRANIKAFTIYGLYGLLIIFALSLALLLVWSLSKGLSLLLMLFSSIVFMSVFYASMYTSYRDIFAQQKSADEESDSDDSTGSDNSDNQDVDHFIV